MIHGINFSQLLKLELYEDFNLEDEIAGPYKPVSSHPIIPSSMRTGLYASHFLPMSDNLDELLLYGWYFRFSTLEVSPKFRVKWEGDNIQIA